MIVTPFFVSTAVRSFTYRAVLVTRSNLPTTAVFRALCAGAMCAYRRTIAADFQPPISCGSYAACRSGSARRTSERISSPPFAATAAIQAVRRLRSPRSQRRLITLPCRSPVAIANRVMSRRCAGDAISNERGCHPEQRRAVAGGLSLDVPRSWRQPFVPQNFCGPWSMLSLRPGSVLSRFRQRGWHRTKFVIRRINLTASSPK